MATGNSDYI